MITSLLFQSIGILKEKFAVLQQGIPFPNMAKAAHCIQSLVIIHNFVLRHDGLSREDKEVIKNTVEPNDNEFLEQPNIPTLPTNQRILDRFY